MQSSKVLTSELTIREFVFRSRAVVTSHSSGSLSEPGTISPRLLQYVSRFSSGGSGAFFLGETLVGDGTELSADHWGLGASKKGIERGYARLLRETEDSGLLIFEQLSHFGGQTWAVPGAIALAPSAISQEISGLTPSPMTLYDIRNTRRAYKTAASRAAAAGLHGIEIKCDQGKLLHQFMSRKYNRRSDEYGGSLDDRLRLVREIAHECHDVAARQSPRPLMSIRLSLTHFADDYGYPAQNSELIEAVDRIKSWKIFDLLSLSLHTNSTYLGYSIGHPLQTELSPTVLSIIERVSRVAEMPVIYAGGVANPATAEWLLTQSPIQLVGMTRALIADPNLVRKAREFQLDSIRPCIGCNQGCVGNTWEGRPLSCTVNPVTGYEKHFQPQPKQSSRKVVGTHRIAVVGAGPAGLEAALEFAAQGIAVSVFEKGAQIGGKLRIATTLPFKSRFGELIEFFERQVSQTPAIELSLNTEATVADMEEFEFVVDARGSFVDTFDRIEAGVSVVSAVTAATRGSSWKGQRVLLLDEDWIQDPLSIALEIEKQGGRVSHILSSREYVGMGLDVVNLRARLSELRRGIHGVSRVMRGFMKLDFIDSEGRVAIADLCSLERTKLRRIDAVVIVQSSQRRAFGARDLVKNQSRLIIVGDACGPRGVEFALRDGKQAAQEIMRRIGDKYEP